MMRFNGILFDRPHSIDADQPAEPACFGDLHLDQVLTSMTAGREHYDLKPFFYTPLRDVAAVRYRHEIARDLEKPKVFGPVRAFAEHMRRMREHLAQAKKLRYKQQKQRWFLDAVDIYGKAVNALADELTRAPVDSRGLEAFRQYLTDYTNSERFTRLVSQTANLLEGLASVRYCVHLRGNRVRVSRYDGEGDYSAEVTETFAKFQQGAVKDRRVKLPNWADMNHVEAQILGLVAQLHPEVFGALDRFYTSHVDFVDPAIGAFDREVQFYLAYLEYIEQFQAAGLPFCYPEVTAESGEVYAEGPLILPWRTSSYRSARRSYPMTSPWRVRSGSWLSPAPTRAARRPSRGWSANCITWPASAFRFPAGEPACCCPTRSSPTSNARKTWPTSAASSRTSWSESTTSWDGRPPAA
jgi:DNA mismatch repair protein MutS